MILHFHGAAREVGRAGCLVETNKQRIMLDYGIKISEEENILPLPVKGLLDGIILSHAHLDHSGAIPTLFHNSEQNIYTTFPTLELTKLLVNDTIKLNKIKQLKPIFSEKHVRRMERSTKQMDYETEKQIGNVSFKFHDAGHIVGAGMIEMQAEKKLVYTGDVKFEETRIHNAAYDKFKNVDVLITEATYGNKEHPPRKQIEKDFVEACWQTCDSNGNVLVPAFAVGRSQEIVEVLYANGFEYPVYLDGMSKGAAEIMMDYPEYIRDYDEFYKSMKNVTWTNTPADRKDALSHPSVIVSTAGMLTGGPAISYLMNMRQKKNQAVFFSGYQVEKTPGKILMEEKRFKYEDFDLSFKSFDIRHFDFSAHSDGKELFEFVKKVKPKLCIVQHGEEEQAIAFQKKVEDELKIPSVTPKFGEKIKVDDYI